MRVHIFRAAFIFMLGIVAFGYFGVSDSNAAACTITGQAYRDMDANGQDDGVLEPGVPGITVTAYDAAGNQATVVTGVDGSYTFTPGDLAALTVGEIRVEFTGLPDYLEPGPSINNLNGGSGDSTVIFVDCSGAGTITGVSTALANPADFCGTDPTVGVICYVFGNQQQGPTAFVTFPYESGTTSQNDNAGVDQPPYTPEAQDFDIGSVWGMAYQRASDSVFMAAFMKRHVGFLQPTDRATGTIFRIDRPNNAITEFLNLNDLFGAGTTGPNPHPFLTNNAPPIPNFEDDLGLGWDGVGKISFGDLQLSDDQRTLYVVNLFNRSLYQIPIGTNDPNDPYGPVAPGAGAIDVFPLNNNTLPGLPCAATWDVDLRPGALGIYNNTVYVGVVCSAESTVADHTDPAVVGDVTALEALVYRFDGTAFTQVASFGLDYPRGTHTNGAPASPANWLPWKNQQNGRAAPFGQVVYPQPMFMDIEFDELGFMIAGIGDRYGHQSGNDNADGGDPTTSVGTVEGVSAGDILRLAPTGGGNWVLENNATSGGITTGGAGNGEGPGGGEYYFHDSFTVLAANPTHDEITLGGLASVPGRGELVVAVFDPPPANQQINGQPPFRSGGVAWFSHATGQRTRSYLVYPFDANFTFGKASGIGDMEVFCGPAPIEIGNIVWEDLDRNGQQDPGEQKLAGVTLTLYIDADFDGTAETLLANTVSDGLGEYYFNESNILDDVAGALIPGLHFYDANSNGVRDPNEPAGVLPNRTYRVALDAAANYGGGPLTNYYITPNDTAVIAQNADIRDSDGVPTVDFVQLASVTNFPEVTLTTGDFGDNNHTYDFGFALEPPLVPTPTPTNTATPEAPGTPGAPIPPDPVPPGVAVDKVADPPFAQPGDIVTWTVIVSNPSGESLPVGEVIDNIPVELIILDAESTLGTVTIDGRSVIVSIASLGPGQSATVTITTRIRDDVAVPFVITNVIGDASASVVSVSRLPDTGE